MTDASVLSKGDVLETRFARGTAVSVVDSVDVPAGSMSSADAKEREH